MEFKEIQDILRLVNRYGLTEVDIERKDFKLKVRNKKDSEPNVIYAAHPTMAAAPQPVPQGPPPPQAPAAPPESAPGESKAAKQESTPAGENHYIFRSPMIGTFYRSPSPDEPAFVEVGAEVTKGQTLCIIEAMKLFNEIESEVSGKIVKVLAEDSQPVEYDQPLFLIEQS